MKVTKQEFTIRYAQQSGVSVTWILERRIPIPCNCDWPQCEGWQMIRLADRDARLLESIADVMEEMSLAETEIAMPYRFGVFHGSRRPVLVNDSCM